MPLAGIKNAFHRNGVILSDHHTMVKTATLWERH
jgi:hypothetical protein